MAIELLIDFDEFWSRLNEDIRLAQQSVFVQTFAFEGDQVGQKLSDALLSSPAQDKRILADSFTRIVLSDRFRYSPANIFAKKLRHEAQTPQSQSQKVDYYRPRDRIHRRNQFQRAQRCLARHDGAN